MTRPIEEQEIQELEVSDEEKKAVLVAAFAEAQRQMSSFFRYQHRRWSDAELLRRRADVDALIETVDAFCRNRASVKDLRKVVRRIVPRIGLPPMTVEQLQQETSDDEEE